MTNKAQKTATEKVPVTMLTEVRIDEFSLVLRPGDKVKLSRTLLEDPRVAGKFTEEA